MPKLAKIALIAAGAIAVLVALFFIVVPLATRKPTEEQITQIMENAGLGEDDWSMEKAYFLPLLNQIVVKKFEIADGALGADKIVVSVKKYAAPLFTGSVKTAGLALALGEVNVEAKSLAAVDFEIDTDEISSAPFYALKKLGKVAASNLAYSQDTVHFSLKSLDCALNYREGQMPASTGIAVKGFALAGREAFGNSAFRSEYKISSLDSKISLSQGTGKAAVSLDGPELCSLKGDLSFVYPEELSGAGIEGLAMLSQIARFDKVTANYADKSLLTHILKIAGVDKNTAGEYASEMLAGAVGSDAERLKKEIKSFFQKPKTLGLKTSPKNPMGFREMANNPLAANIVFSLNGGKEFKVMSPYQ